MVEPGGGGRMKEPSPSHTAAAQNQQRAQGSKHCDDQETIGFSHDFSINVVSRLLGFLDD